MAQRAFKACRKCGKKTHGQYCEAHQHLAQPFASVEERQSAHKRGYDRRWRQRRESYLRQHPLCRECGKQGTNTLATEVDHIVPHRGDYTLFWDESNWQPLCKRCHTKKTATEHQGGHI